MNMLTRLPVKLVYIQGLRNAAYAPTHGVVDHRTLAEFSR